MDANKTLRQKIRNLIMEYEMGSQKFFMHGEGGDHFPYEYDDNKKSDKEEKDIDKKSKDLGMEPTSGAALHLTNANM